MRMLFILAISVAVQAGVASAQTTSDLRQQVARFSASCPTNLASTVGYKDLSSSDRDEICACVDREVAGVFKNDPYITPSSFGSQYRSIISSCSRASFVLAYEASCRSNNAEVRVLVSKQPLSGEQLNQFCKCMSTEIWDWQKARKSPPSADLLANGGGEVALICDAKL